MMAKIIHIAAIWFCMSGALIAQEAKVVNRSASADGQPDQEHLTEVQSRILYQKSSTGKMFKIPAYYNYEDVQLEITDLKKSGKRRVYVKYSSTTKAHFFYGKLLIDRPEATKPAEFIELLFDENSYYKIAVSGKEKVKENRVDIAEVNAREREAKRQLEQKELAKKQVLAETRQKNIDEVYKGTAKLHKDRGLDALEVEGYSLVRLEYIAVRDLPEKLNLTFYGSNEYIIMASCPVDENNFNITLQSDEGGNPAGVQKSSSVNNGFHVMSVATVQSRGKESCGLRVENAGGGSDKTYLWVIVGYKSKDNATNSSVCAPSCAGLPGPSKKEAGSDFGLRGGGSVIRTYSK
jgi:hypothetical protein